LTLPNGVNLVVEDKKVREYLLSTTHPIGRVKASFFGTLGFGPEKPTELATALVIHVADGEVMDREPTLYGT
jgi:hypothetical protein